MSDGTRDLLVRGIAAAKAGDEKEALFYLDWVLRLDPPIHQRIDAWYWLSEIVTDSSIQREYLEKILVHDPSDGRARRKLSILDGKLNPEDIIDPDRVSKEGSKAPIKSEVEKFNCPHCGGRLTYTADGQSLVCEYCESRQQLSQVSGKSGFIQERDFHAALATSQGHHEPISAHSINCGGCSAVLILESGQISQTCPYCLTPYALDQIRNGEIIPPDGILPLELTEEQALNHFSNWFHTELPDFGYELAASELIYLPVWTFDLGGQVFWNCKVKKDRHWTIMEGHEIVYHNDLPIFATQKIPEELVSVLSDFDFSKMIEFDRRYLAGIKAENYQISAGDASLKARQKALDDQRRKIIDRISSQVTQLRLDSTKIIVEMFRLIFVPVCLVQFEISGERFQGLINGQTGKVIGQKPVHSKKSFLDSLFG
jgi:uncharacterized CHY-type Zn-finger protein